MVSSLNKRIDKLISMYSHLYEKSPLEIIKKKINDLKRLKIKFEELEAFE